MEKRLSRIFKIAIIGPESTGKSTLAQALADYYGEPFVPEIARNYVANLNRPYKLKDIELMADMQINAEIELMPNARKFLFCDTTLLVHKIWAKFVFNEVPSRVINAYDPMSYPLHLLCNIDLVWVPDPLREHPNQREELFRLYKNELIDSKVNYKMISGMQEQRLKQAINEINQFIEGDY